MTEAKVSVARNGKEALEREDAKEIPIIVMTANAFAEGRRKSKEAGVNEHLSKPVNVIIWKKKILLRNPGNHEPIAFTSKKSPHRNQCSRSLAYAAKADTERHESCRR